MALPKEIIERLVYFRKEIDRLIQGYRGKSAVSDESNEVQVWVDIFEGKENITIEVEIPGVKKEDISLSVLSDIIVVEGNKLNNGFAENPSGKISFHTKERTSGQFRRIIEIPKAGDTRNIAAKYHQGVVTITLPKVQDRRGQKREIPIE